MLGVMRFVGVIHHVASKVTRWRARVIGTDQPKLVSTPIFVPEAYPEGFFHAKREITTGGSDERAPSDL